MPTSPSSLATNSFTYFMPPAGMVTNDKKGGGEERVQEIASLPATTTLKADYDGDVMTDFLSAMVCGIVQPSQPPSPAFKKFVSQILQSTQLPSSSILLGLSYLSSYASLTAAHSPAGVYRLLIGSLLLANKFLDDNTFTNKSWAEISGLAVGDVNTLERGWLGAMGWDLHITTKGQRGWFIWSESWVAWNSRMPAFDLRLPRPVPLTHPYGTYGKQDPPFTYAPQTPVAPPSPYFYQMVDVEGYAGQCCRCEYCQIAPSYMQVAA